MTDSSTPCWKNAPLKPTLTHVRRNQRADAWVRCWVALTWAWALVGALLLPVQAHAEGAPLEITQLRAERTDDGVYLSAQMRLELPPSVEDALSKGLALFFVAEADVLQERWYWSDRSMASRRRYLRLAYQPLTRRWRLNQSSEPLTNTGLGVSISQHFDSLSEALQAVQRLSQWKIADSNVLDTESKHTVDFRFRLDVSQLPRPFQMGVVGQSDWNLVASRKLRIRSESGK